MRIAAEWSRRRPAVRNHLASGSLLGIALGVSAGTALSTGVAAVVPQSQGAGQAVTHDSQQRRLPQTRLQRLLPLPAMRFSQPGLQTPQHCVFDAFTAHAEGAFQDCTHEAAVEEGEQAGFTTSSFVQSERSKRTTVRGVQVRTCVGTSLTVQVGTAFVTVSSTIRVVVTATFLVTVSFTVVVTQTGTFSTT